MNKKALSGIIIIWIIVCLLLLVGLGVGLYFTWTLL